MKEKLNNKYLAWGLTVFCTLAALMLLFFAIYRWHYIASFFVTVVDILMPFVFGLAIAYLMNPLVNFFEKKVYKKLVSNRKGKKIKLARVLSLATSTIIFLGVVVACFSFFLPSMIDSLDMFISNSTIYLSNSKELLMDVFKNSESIVKFIDENYDNFQKFFLDWLDEGFLNDFMITLGDSIFGTIKFLYNMIIGYIISIYVLYDKEKFRAQTKKLLYTFFGDDKINIILENIRYTDRIFGDFFAGKCIDSLIIGILCFIGMLVLDMPYELLIAVVVGVTNIIPYFGPFIGAIPSALLILLVDPGKCITFIIFIFILQQFDGNILGPKILGNKTGLSSFWVLFSLLIFGGLFGVVGMIIGVPIFSIFYSFINGLIKKKLKDKNLPVDSKDYENVETFVKKKRK
ncbi:MAG: AI-2E family transporter [Bacilli bacterium]|nr:AI-2E family transporter [Bacilli bacterium]